MTLDIPPFLRINPEERRAAWNELASRRAMVPRQEFPKPVLEEDKMSKSNALRSAPKPAQAAVSPRRGKAASKARSRATPPRKGASPPSKAIRPGSKLEIVAKLLKRPSGCTAADILEATEWPSVSVPQQAKAAGLTLRQEKDGKVTRYWGS